MRRGLEAGFQHWVQRKRKGLRTGQSATLEGVETNVFERIRAAMW
jgi:hypothetical protein